MAATQTYNDDICSFLREMNASPYQTSPYHRDTKSIIDDDEERMETERVHAPLVNVNLGVCEATALEMNYFPILAACNGNLSNSAQNHEVNGYVSDVTRRMYDVSGLCEATRWEMTSGTDVMVLKYAGDGDTRAETRAKHFIVCFYSERHNF